MSAESGRDDLLRPAPAGLADGGYDSSGKSPDEIEQDIGETRAGLGAILDELERKLAPRQLLERGVDMLKDTMSGEAGRLGETLRGHPLPLVLIGIGVGWMVMSTTGRGGRLGERVSGALRDAGQRAGALAGQMREKVAGMTSSAAAASAPEPYPTESAGYAYARQKSGEAMGQARDYAEKAGETLHDARDRLTQLVEDHPLAMGALGLVAGTMIAALLPRSAAEERLVGPAGEQIRDSAAGLGREAVERAQQVAERTVDAAADTVRQAVNEAGDAARQKSSASV